MLKPGDVGRLPHAIDGHSKGEPMRVIGGPSGDGCFEVMPLWQTAGRTFWSHLNEDGSHVDNLLDLQALH